MAAKKSPTLAAKAAATKPDEGGVAASHRAAVSERAANKPDQSWPFARIDVKATAANPTTAGPAKTGQERPAPSTPGLAVVLIAITILICIAAAMRLDRPVVRDRAAPAAASLELRIDLNAATEAELQLLPMIGPTLAERIVDDRELNGPFAAIDDLARVRGIGRVIIERIAPFATVEP